MRIVISSTVLCLVLSGLAWGQNPPRTEHEEINIDTYANLLRQDVKTQKVAIISYLMALTPEQAARFWPLYEAYDKELTKFGDEKLQGIKKFAENYGAMSEPVASELTAKALDLESRRTELKKRTVQKMGQALSPKIAGRFLQIENQLLMILDLQIASSLPVVE
jgi:hypothetical protein